MHGKACAGRSHTTRPPHATPPPSALDKCPGAFRAYLDSTENPRALEVQHALEGVRVEVSRSRAEVVETPQHGICDEERVVFEEKVLVLVHALRD